MTAVRHPGKTAQHGCYAYLPGTGPAGQACLNCASRNTVRSAYGEHSYCRKWREMTPDRKIKQKTIDPYMPACKYFTPAARQRPVSDPPIAPLSSDMTINNYGQDDEEIQL